MLFVHFLFLKLVDMVPFLQAITISSVCNQLFWPMFLKSVTRYPEK
jgi:hypothetical protein